jgi:hypothetical protein
VAVIYDFVGPRMQWELFEGKDARPFWLPSTYPYPHRPMKCYDLARGRPIRCDACKQVVVEDYGVIS